MRCTGSVTDRYSMRGGSDPGWTTSTGSQAVRAETSKTRMTGAQPGTLLNGCGSFPKGWAVLFGGSATGLTLPSWASAVPVTSTSAATNTRRFMAVEISAIAPGVKERRWWCREHMICPLPRASEMSAFAGRRATAIVNQGGDDGARRGRPGAGHEDPRGHHASVGWSHHLVAGGRYPGPRSAQCAALARPLRSRGARRAL